MKACLAPLLALALARVLLNQPFAAAVSAKSACMAAAVWGVMPSAAGMAQAGESVRRPSIWTAHTKHDAAGSIPGTWHMAGMRIPSRRAASSTVVPGSTLIRRASIVRVTIAYTTSIASSWHAWRHISQRVQRRSSTSCFS